MMGNSEKLMMAAFYKYGVKAIRFMFAVLKELSGFIPAVGGKKSKKFIEYSKKCSISFAYFKLYQQELFGI